MTTNDVNLDNFRFASGQNVQGFLGKLVGYRQNTERAQQQAQSGRQGSGMPITFGFAEVEIYKSNFPVALGQYTLDFFVNQEAQSGAWYEFSDTMRKVFPTQDNKFSDMLDKFFNCRYEMTLGRRMVAGEWTDIPIGVWHVKAIADALDGARLPDDQAWDGTDSTMAQADGGLFSMAAQKATGQSTAETQPAISGVPAAPANPAIARNALILELADNQDAPGFQRAAFTDERSQNMGLDSEVMDTTGVGVLAPFVESGELVTGDDGKYHKNVAQPA